MKFKDVNFGAVLNEIGDNAFHNKKPNAYRIKCGNDEIELKSTYEEQSHEDFVLYYWLFLNSSQVYKSEEQNQLITFLQSFLNNKEFELIEERNEHERQIQQETEGAEDKQDDGKKAYAEKKRAELNATYKLIDETAEKIFTRSESSADVVKLLDIYNKFRSLGITNSLLIFAQKPNAKEVHNLQYWNEHGYQFKRGQKSFFLIERGKEYTKPDGKKGYWRNAVRYFDVSQTTASFREPLVDTYSSHALVKAMLKSSPVKYENYLPEGNDEDWPDFIKAKYYPNQRKIAIRKDLSAEVFLIHYSTALAMSMLDRGGDFREHLTLYQFDAKCIAYLLCKRYNIDCSLFDFDNIPSEYMNYDTTRIKQKLYEIVDVEKTIHEKMYRNLQDVLKEYQETVNDNTKQIGVYQEPSRS